MSQVNVIPGDRDTGVGSLAVVILVLAIVFFGFFAYYRGWFAAIPSPATPSSSINISVPGPLPAPVPTPTTTSPTN